MYEVKITAHSLSELAGKLVAMAATMSAIPADAASVDTLPSVATDAPVTRSRSKPKAEPKPEPQPEVQPEVQQTPAQEPEPQPEPEKAAEPVALDFDRDVAPVVIEAVKVKGKPWVAEILDQFGVERASQIDDARMPEFVEMVRAGLA